MALDRTIDGRLAGVRRVILNSLANGAGAHARSSALSSGPGQRLGEARPTGLASVGRRSPNASPLPPAPNRESTRRGAGKHVETPPAWIAGGKMLRSRLLLRVGEAAGVPEVTQFDVAAAVEMLHGASLLHDDVVDGGRLRRGEPAFWVENGMKSAILMGDLVVCRAFLLVQETGDDTLMHEFIRASVEMCEAEVEQELGLQDAAPDWDTCVSLARRKTGSLFAFAGVGGAGADARLRDALREAGYAIGTTYQLADDILDAYGDPQAAGKTLGSDAAGAKVTAAAALRCTDINLRDYVERAWQRAEAGLARWPGVRAAWRAYVDEDVGPVIRACLDRLPNEAFT